MNGLSRCEEVAVREVISAVGMLGERNGSTVTDIYFVLDSVHGRVQRTVIQHALKSAVSKGLLSCNNRRYKLCKARQPPVSRSPNRPRAMPYPRYGFFSEYNMHDRTYGRWMDDVPKRRGYAKSTSSRTYTTGESYILSGRPARGLLACKCSRSTSEDSYATTELSSLSSVWTPQRNVAKTRPRRKYRFPMPKRVVKVEERGSPEPTVSRAQTNSSVDAEQPNRDETKSSCRTDEEIKAVIRQTMVENKAETDTANEVQVLMDVKSSDKFEESKESKSSEESKSTNSQNSEDAKSSGKSQGARSSSCELVDNARLSNSEKTSEDWMEVDSENMFQQPSCSHFDPKQVICIDASEDEIHPKSATQKEKFRYLTRSRAKAEKRNRSPTTSSHCSNKCNQSTETSHQKKAGEEESRSPAFVQCPHANCLQCKKQS